jgi:hypothetical protein
MVAIWWSKDQTGYGGFWLKQPIVSSGMVTLRDVSLFIKQELPMVFKAIIIHSSLKQDCRLCRSKPSVIDRWRWGLLSEKILLCIEIQLALGHGCRAIASGPLAQLVDQATLIRQVTGSIPTRSTSKQQSPSENSRRGFAVAMQGNKKRHTRCLGYAVFKLSKKGR